MLLCGSPLGFFRAKDRSQMEFPDPFPGLQHETAEVNGVKCAALHRVSAACERGSGAPGKATLDMSSMLAQDNDCCLPPKSCEGSRCWPGVGVTRPCLSK